MRSDDYTFATYRGHAHTLARRVPMTPVLAELLGRENGLMAGKGGSMHLTSVEHGMMGSYAIVGSHLPIACGAALERAVSGERAGRGVLFRRRCDQYRRLPRSPESGLGLEAARRVRLREQPLHGVHADRGRHRCGAAGSGSCPPRMASSRWSSTATTRTRCTRSPAPHLRAHAPGRPEPHRGLDLSAWRSFPSRSG